MKYRDWSDFVVHCSGIHEIMAKPREARDLNAKQKLEYETLRQKEDLTEKEIGRLNFYTNKVQYFNDPPLSKTAIKYLMKRYAWDRYNNKIAATGVARSPVAKGNQLEDEAIAMLSDFDKANYKKITESKSNDYLLGCCDIFCSEQDKIIDVKTVWNINTFLPHLTDPLDKKYWYQMQGYLEVYNVSHGEVCYVLLNTPPHLIERERAKYTEKYVFGEIDRERYDEEMEKLDMAFSYDKIPNRRRIIRFVVERHPDIMPIIYHRVEKCRVWLNEFERKHVLNKKIITLPEVYAKQQEDNPEPDPADTRESN